MIFLPSVISGYIEELRKIYYKLPWEITADMFGGVTRTEHNNSAKVLGTAYFAGSEFVSNAFVKPTLLPLYSTAAALIDGIIPGLGTFLLITIYGS